MHTASKQVDGTLCVLRLPGNDCVQQHYHLPQTGPETFDAPTAQSILLQCLLSTACVHLTCRQNTHPSTRGRPHKHLSAKSDTAKPNAARTSVAPSEAHTGNLTWSTPRSAATACTLLLSCSSAKAGGSRPCNFVAHCYIVRVHAAVVCSLHLYELA